MCQLNVGLRLRRFNQLEFIEYSEVVCLDDVRHTATAAGGRVKMTRCAEGHYRYKRRRWPKKRPV
jgi:hypothetical protein